MTPSARAAAASSSSRVELPTEGPIRRSPTKSSPAPNSAAAETNNLVEVPAYVSPIAVIYNLPDVTSLKLDPETLANIFAQKITKWNDPAIVATNQDVTLPDTNITPVNRSDESGND